MWPCGLVKTLVDHMMDYITIKILKRPLNRGFTEAHCQTSGNGIEEKATLNFAVDAFFVQTYHVQTLATDEGEY